MSDPKSNKSTAYHCREKATTTLVYVNILQQFSWSPSCARLSEHKGKKNSYGFYPKRNSSSGWADTHSLLSYFYANLSPSTKGQTTVGHLPESCNAKPSADSRLFLAVFIDFLATGTACLFSYVTSPERQGVYAREPWEFTGSELCLPGKPSLDT